MKEIEVKEYVRTNKGNIGKVVEIRLGLNKDTELYQTIYILDNGLWTILDYIVKHSKQLIDLIEVGDFVNGYRVLAIKSSIYENSKRILIYRNEREKYERWIYIQEYNGRIKTQDDIVVILTKEQYMANCYKVGGEDESTR